MAHDVDEVINRLLAELDQAGVGPYAAVLHGSAARGQYLPGWSDINLVLVFQRISPQTLRAMQAPLRWWRDTAGALPLMLTEAEWRRAADAYPLEIAEMRTAYRVVRGDDPLAGLVVRRADLRAALERELRGKLLRLRQGYALFATRPAELSHLVRRSVAAVLFLFRGLAVLAGQEPPRDAAALVALAGRLAGFDPRTLEPIVTHRDDDSWRCSDEVMAGYLGAVETTAHFVDHFQIGDQA
jgi:predicted nucleotidyltransferase